MKKVLLVSLTAILAAAVGAEAGGAAAGLKVGTLGIGADVTVGLHKRFNLRVSGNYLNFEYDDTIDDLDYSLDVDYKTGIALLDIHPFANAFRISAGGVYSQNTVGLTGTPSEPEEIGDHTYSPEEIGDLKGDLSFDDFAPYVGIGFGHAVGEDQSVSFIFDLGVIYQSYEVELRATGPISQHPQFQQDLQREEDDIQEDLDGYKVYPVLAVGIAFKF